MLESVEVWIIPGAIAGFAWSSVSRRLGMSRRAQLLLAVPFSIAMIWNIVLTLVLSFAIQWHGYTSFPSLLGGGGAAVLATVLFTRRQTSSPPAFSKAGLWAIAVACIPGGLFFIGGLIPHEEQFAEEVRAVEGALPAIEQHLEQHGACPAKEKVILPHTTSQLTYFCRGEEFGFCIWGAFDPIHCWNSKSRRWDFE